MLCFLGPSTRANPGELHDGTYEFAGTTGLPPRGMAWVRPDPQHPHLPRPFLETWALLADPYQSTAAQTVGSVDHQIFEPWVAANQQLLGFFRCWRLMQVTDCPPSHGTGGLYTAAFFGRVGGDLEMTQCVVLAARAGPVEDAWESWAVMTNPLLSQSDQMVMDLGLSQTVDWGPGVPAPATFAKWWAWAQDQQGPILHRKMLACTPPLARPPRPG